MTTYDEIQAWLAADSRTPPTYDELLLAAKGDASPRIVEAMVAEIVIHRDAMAPSLIRATRLYTDEIGALRKRVAEIETQLVDRTNEALRHEEHAQELAAELGSGAVREDLPAQRIEALRWHIAEMSKALHGVAALLRQVPDEHRRWDAQLPDHLAEIADRAGNSAGNSAGSPRPVDGDPS